MTEDKLLDHFYGLAFLYVLFACAAFLFYAFTTALAAFVAAWGCIVCSQIWAVAGYFVQLRRHQ